MFTCSQILEIREKLAAQGIMCSSLPLAQDLKGNELIHLVLNGKDVVATLRSIIDKAIAWNVTDFINVSKDGNSYTLLEVIKSVPEINRKQGQVITFINKDTDTWVTYQFQGQSNDEWYDINLWESIYDDAHFKGWYINECMLNKYSPNPKVGDYAYIGNACENSIIYMCVTDGEWYNTGKHISEGMNGTGAANISFTDTFSNIKAKAVNGELVPGAIYTITDYRCSQIVPEANIEHLSDRVGWNITLLAVNNKEFSEDATITIQPDGNYKGNKIVECKYSIYKEGFNWTKDVTDSNFYGVIYHMKDEFGNLAPYDFKNIVFARYKVLDIAANTTPSNASLNGPFRCFGLEGATLPDARAWVGSGHSFEKTLVPAIYNGTFTEITGLFSPTTGLVLLDDDYINYLHKPFNWFRWLSWKPTTLSLNDEIATAGYYGALHYVTVDSSSSDKMKLVYTFNIVDNLGNVREGSSESAPYVGSPLNDVCRFSDNVIGGNSAILSSDLKRKLPNLVVFLFDKDNAGNASWCNKNYLKGYSSTFLIHPYGTYTGYTQRMELMNFGKGDTNVGCIRSIICGPHLRKSDFVSVLNSYFAAGLYMVRGTMNGCNLFGYFSGCEFMYSSCNLLFGTYQYIKVKGDSTWKSVGIARGYDGSYWYNVYTHDWFSYNIMNAFLYAIFWPHVNTNTVVDGYNKNVEIRGNCQTNYFRGLNWDTVVGYAACNGIETAHIEQSDLCSHAFVVSDGNHGTTWYKIKEGTPIPRFSVLDFKTGGMLPSAFIQYKTNNPSLSCWSLYGFGYTQRAIVTNASGVVNIKNWSSL